MFQHLRIDSSLMNFLTYSCIFRIISIHSTNKTLWDHSFMKTYKKFRKPFKLVLACMTRSKRVQIDWILMILINLTQFLMYFLEIFLGLAQKTLSFSVTLWKIEKYEKYSQWILLVGRLWNSWICLIFGRIYLKFSLFCDRFSSWNIFFCFFHKK